MASYGPARGGAKKKVSFDPIGTKPGGADDDGNADGIVFENMDVEKVINVENIDVDDKDAMDDETAYDVEKMQQMKAQGKDVSQFKTPAFKPLSATDRSMDPKIRKQLRRIAVPAHRLTPLKNVWAEGILQPLVEHMKLQVRFNVKRRAVEIRMGPATTAVSSLQKACDFVKAFVMGFEVQDAIALLRLDDLFIESFEVRDVKTLNGDHLGRCIGRIAGKGGQTRFAIENATRTRVVIANSHVHILGSFSNIKIARTAICNLIMGAAPGKVYNHLRTVTRRVQEKL